MLNDDKGRRPLSPHLQIYKVQITSFLSILHRGTGLVLYGGSIIWALWFVMLAMGSHTYHMMQSFLLSSFGLILLAGWSFSFFYHLCNGVRHLIWDAGHGYDLPLVRATGWLVVIASFTLTGLAWILGICVEKSWI